MLDKVITLFHILRKLESEANKAGKQQRQVGLGNWGKESG